MTQNFFITHFIRSKKLTNFDYDMIYDLKHVVMLFTFTLHITFWLKKKFFIDEAFFHKKWISFPPIFRWCENVTWFMELECAFEPLNFFFAMKKKKWKSFWSVHKFARFNLIISTLNKRELKYKYLVAQGEICEMLVGIFSRIFKVLWTIFLFFFLKVVCGIALF